MQTDSFFFMIGLVDYATSYVSQPKATATYTALPLTVGVTPSSLKAGGNVTLSYGNRLDQTLSVQLKYNSTVLSSFATADDTDTVATSFNWFKTAGVTGNSMKVDVTVSDELGRTGSTSFTLTRDALSVGVTPSSVAVGNSVTLSFTNRFTQTLSVVLKYGSTQLTSFSVSADSRVVNTATDWFTTAGVTGNSMRVDVSVSDGTGRTATTYFTVTRSGLSVGVSPSSVNLGSSVTLSFSGRYGNSVTVQFKYGTQLLESKTATSDSLSITPPLSWFTAAGTTGSMRVDVLATDSTGRTASANFTLVMPGLTVSASPSSLYTGNAVTITLGNRLDQSVTLVLRYQQTELYRTTMNAYSASITAQESWFTTASVTGNTMQVTATVSDGLGRTASSTFTVNKPTGSTATPTEPVNVSKSGTGKIAFKWTYSGNGTQTKAELQWKTSSGDWQSLGTVNGAGTSYTAAAYKFPQGAISWRVRVTNSFGLVGSWSTASFNVSYAALSVSASPASIYVDNPVTLSFTNRLSRALSVVIKYNDTVLKTLSASSDSVQITPTSDWFSTASVTASSMQVTAAVSDGLGRTASSTFTVNKPTGSTATPTEPVNVSKSGTGQIAFKWTYSGNGTQTKAELQWKTSSGDWQSLGTVNGAGTSYTAAAYKFPQGTISWRVRVTNSFGLTGGWSSASFTVSYAALSVSASPASVYVDYQGTLSFTNRLSQTLLLEFRANGQVLQPAWEVVADQVNFKPTEAWFSTAGVTDDTMQVTVSISDALGRTATDRFTAKKPQASTATPTEPVSVSKNGAAAIAFKWTYAGDGIQTKAELQWKTSSGDWQSLGTVNGAGSSYSAAAYKFPQGSVNWRVRVTNSFGLVGNWSSASFNVSYAALSVSASPASVYINNQGTLTFTNRLSRTLLLEFRANGQVLQPAWEVVADQVNFKPTEAWFSTAGVTDDTMQVTVSISDALGRTATDRFTAKKPQASTATPTEPVSVSKNGAAAIAFKWTYAGDGIQKKAELQWKTSSGDWQSLGTVNGAGSSYSAAAYKFPQGSVNWRVRVTNSFGIVGSWSGSTSFSVSYAALSVSASPSSVYINNQGTLSFTNRLGRTLLLEFRANGTVLQPAWEVVADQVNFKPTAAWFETAEVTGSSMQVTATISDALGRTASTTFTAVNPQGSTATPTAPKSTTVDGAGSINFAWSVSSDWGQQIKAELQWSTDSVVWTDLTTISGSDQTWTAPAVEFPAGTIYWRARVTNVFGILGDWSSPVSFTVSYAAVSQVVQVNSQTSGIFARGAAKTFSARFEASGPVYSPFTFQTATFKWRSSTSGDWTEVTMTSSDNGVTAATTIPAGTFPQGVMQWMIEGTDNTGRTTETPVYTLTAATSAVDVSPIRPVNTVETNNSEIGFELSFVSLDGSLPQAAEWRWSSDGAEWHSETLTALDIRDGVLAFTIPAGTFPAGTIRWQARAENSADTWGEWSGVVSFKALGAPVVAAITGDGKPFLTISWQTLSQGEYGQQAYKVEVDGKLYGPYFGADVRSYTLKEPLARGSHTIRVAAQNRFGLWSEWTEAQVSVVNIPGSVSFFPAAMAEGPFAHIVMIYAHPAPTITQQPQDYRAETGNARFSFKSRGFASGTKYQPRGTGTSVSWFFRTGPGAEWQEYHGPFDGAAATPEASQAIDGYQYRVMLDTDTGRIYSEPATFYYGTPAGPASELKEGTWRSDTGYFMIYRDGVLIGTTYENEFYDYAAIGTHTYRVIQVVRLGNFVEGTPLPDYETVTVTVDAPTLITLDGKKVLSLTLSEDARRVQNIQRAREVAYTQYEGAVFPEAETGEHESLSVSGDCAWTWEQQAEADAFEAMLGTPVIYKTPGGEMVVGVLDGFTQRDAHFYRTARFTVQQMDWRDYRDEP